MFKSLVFYYDDLFIQVCVFYQFEKIMIDIIGYFDYVYVCVFLKWWLWWKIGKKKWKFKNY